VVEAQFAAQITLMRRRGDDAQRPCPSGCS
jgi:hypothetical protein